MTNQFKNTYFEKVSPKQFCIDMKDKHPIFSKCEVGEFYSNLKLPIRATKKSACYDFYLPFDIELGINHTNNSILIPTGIKASMEDFLSFDAYPRSGLGFKYEVKLANTVGIMDADFYNNKKNEGHIIIKLVNGDNSVLRLSAGDRFCQGKFTPYYITYDDCPLTEERNGGLGHTGL